MNLFLLVLGHGSLILKQEIY